MKEKEDEKAEKCHDLAREVEIMSGVMTMVVPVVVGALGSIPLKVSSCS